MLDPGISRLQKPSKLRATFHPYTRMPANAKEFCFLFSLHSLNILKISDTVDLVREPPKNIHAKKKQVKKQKKKKENEKKG